MRRLVRSFRTPVFVMCAAPGRLAVATSTPYTLLAPCWSRQSVKPPWRTTPSSRSGFDLQREGSGRDQFSRLPGDKTPGPVPTSGNQLRSPSMPGLSKSGRPRPHRPGPNQLLSLLADWRPKRGPQDGDQGAASGPMARVVPDRPWSRAGWRSVVLNTAQGQRKAHSRP